MTTYNPDKWVMLKFTNKGKVIYKVLASWYGGYAKGDSWKLNSGCTGIEEDGQLYRFSGSSGSVYQVHKATYGMSGYTMGVFASFKKQIEDLNDPEVTMELMPDTTNFMELHYE
jgi:hypothetical protein